MRLNSRPSALKAGTTFHIQLHTPLSDQHQRPARSSVLSERKYAQPTVPSSQRQKVLTSLIFIHYYYEALDVS